MLVLTEGQYELFNFFIRMFNWLKTLHMHHFGVQKSELPARADTGIGQAYNQIQKLHRVQEVSFVSFLGE